MYPIISMNIFTKIQRHAAMASGNFATLFKNIEINPLPAAISRLLQAINTPEPDLNAIGRLVESIPEMSAQIIKMVNSALFSPRTPVLSVRHGVTLLGLRHIRPLIYSFAALQGTPRPTTPLFDQKAFWTDSLFRAITARSLTKQYAPEQCDDAFTATLLADIALPVLLTEWQEYYEPLIDQWLRDNQPLSHMEKEQFGWHHGLAGAWILRHWGFPEELVCFVGIHNQPVEVITELEIQDTVAIPVITASLLPSTRKLQALQARNLLPFVDTALSCCQEDPARFRDMLAETEAGFLDTHALFDLPVAKAQSLLALTREAYRYLACNLSKGH